MPDAAESQEITGHVYRMIGWMDRHHALADRDCDAGRERLTSLAHFKTWL